MQRAQQLQACEHAWPAEGRGGGGVERSHRRVVQRQPFVRVPRKERTESRKEGSASDPAPSTRCGFLARHSRAGDRPPHPMWWRDRDDVLPL